MNSSFYSFSPLILACTTQFRTEFCSVSQCQGTSSPAGCAVSAACGKGPCRRFLRLLQGGLDAEPAWRLPSLLRIEQSGPNHRMPLFDWNHYFVGHFEKEIFVAWAASGSQRADPTLLDPSGNEPMTLLGGSPCQLVTITLDLPSNWFCTGAWPCCPCSVSTFRHVDLSLWWSNLKNGTVFSALYDESW